MKKSLLPVSVFLAFFALLVSLTPGWAPAVTASQCSQWNLASDFLISPNQENPNRDSCGNPNVWNFMASPTLTRDPQTYFLLPHFYDDLYHISGFEGWMGDATVEDYHVNTPNVLFNATGNTLSIGGGTTFLPNTVSVHPAPTQLVIVGWQSPITGNVAITGAVTDEGTNCGDGIGWFIDKGSTNLASGSYPNGGSQSFQNGTGGNALNDVAVNQGDSLYFAVHPKANYYCDSTRLDITIRPATPTYSISGQVTDTSNNPVSGVTISDGVGDTATTDGGGNYAFSGLQPATYTLSPSMPNFTFAPPSIVVSVPPDASGQDFAGNFIPPAPNANWAGYGLTAQNYQVTDVIGQWVVPSIDCTAPREWAGIWVGIDGLGAGNSTVEQTGAFMYCDSNSQPHYNAFGGMFPTRPRMVPADRLAVHPGDRLAAEVQYTGSGSFTLILQNLTTNQLFRVVHVNQSAMAASAEWIVEGLCRLNVPICDLNSSAARPLVNFGAVNFSNAKATINGVTGTISFFPSNFPLTMRNSSGQIKAVPSTLSDEGADFDVTWVAR